MALSNEDMLKLYRLMVLSRKVDQGVMSNSGKCAPSIHPGIGQEAIGVGACAFLRKDDWICQTHRGFAHIVAKGLSLNDLFAEAFCRAASPTKGRGGLWHQCKPSIGIPGLSGTIGGQYNLGTGLGIACQYHKRGQVVLCFFGDGASNRGTLHEGMNMSALWKLPVVFIAENNQYCMVTNIKNSINVPNIADFAGSYGIPGIVVDGNDVLAVHEVVSSAVERARRGEGPSLIECKTYRIWGHTLADPADYRDPAEVEEWKRKDPIDRFRNFLLDKGILTPAMVEQTDRESEAEVEAAVAYADSCPPPDPSTCTEEVYA